MKISCMCTFKVQNSGNCKSTKGICSNYMYIQGVHQLTGGQGVTSQVGRCRASTGMCGFPPAEDAVTMLGRTPTGGGPPPHRHRNVHHRHLQDCRRSERLIFQ